MQLPDLNEPSICDDSNTRRIATQKRAIYHSAMETVLQPLVQPSHAGEYVRCGDGIVVLCNVQLQKMASRKVLATLSAAVCVIFLVVRLILAIREKAEGLVRGKQATHGGRA